MTLSALGKQAVNRLTLRGVDMRYQPFVHLVTSAILVTARDEVSEETDRGLINASDNTTDALGVSTTSEKIVLAILSSLRADKRNHLVTCFPCLVAGPRIRRTPQRDHLQQIPPLPPHFPLLLVQTFIQPLFPCPLSL
jgi:hypothetical protein